MTPASVRVTTVYVPAAKPLVRVSVAPTGTPRATKALLVSENPVFVPVGAPAVMEPATDAGLHVAPLCVYKPPAAVLHRTPVAWPTSASVETETCVPPALLLTVVPGN